MDREIYQRQETFIDVFLHLLQVETRASQNALEYAVLYMLVKLDFQITF